MNSRPVGTKEHRVVNINSVEEEERVGLVQRHTTRDNKRSMLEMMESSTVAAAKTTQQFVMEIKNHNETLSSIFYCLMIGIFIIYVIGMSFSGIILGIVTYFEEEPAMASIVVHVEEASLSRFALVTSPSPAVLNYNLTVTMSIYTPPPYELQTTKPLEAAFFFSGRRFHVVPLTGTGEMLSKTRLFSRGPLTGEVALPGDAGVVAEYRNSTRMFGGGAGADGPGDVHEPLRHMQGGGHLPAQAASRDAGRNDDCAGVREGEMPARQDGQ
ncbi:unnamed protein product [Urochloa humidicola]